MDLMNEPEYKPMTYQELAEHFGVTDAKDYKAFLKQLNQLEEEGKIHRTRTERYGIPERMNLLRGRMQAHAKGFGFLIPEDREHQDVYIHANDMRGAMNGDIVLVRITTRSAAGGKIEGEVVRIVQRAVTQVVGVFENLDSYGFVNADDKRIGKDIFVPKTSFMGAVTGDKVVVRIVTYPEGRAAATGEVIEVLGHKDDPGVDIISIIRKHQLPEAFPEEVMHEAENAPDSITDDEIVQQKRRDLRNKRIVTIDGEDAKDLDDAVNVERLPNGNVVLGVHIADVGYYVREGSALDREAYNRGCSVYLVDRVIPMLPHRLSNGICSLNPKVDRLTLSCEMEFDDKAMVVRHDIFTSVIKTTERMTYSNVRKILNDEDPELIERYGDLVEDFRLMRDLAMSLRKARMRRGAIDFDFQESKVLVDENGKPTDIVKRERSIAEQIIEEFMLAANETVAEHFHWLKVPFLYRVHDDPDPEKLMTFMQFAANFGYMVKGRGNSVHPRALQTLLEEISGTKEETVISTVMLRSMKQAKYDAQSLGHFGLAAEFYSHFTSPIRRYPDLVIHRVIREVIENGGLSEQRHDYLSGRMPDIAQQSSERERVAVDAERDTEQLKKAEYMLDKIGEEFDGIISSVTNFGIFIELENTVEGLIRLSDLTDDYYHFHDQHLALIGERTSRVYRIGDEVKIRVSRVNMDDHTIDFEMVEAKSREKASLIEALAVGRRPRGGAGGRGGRGEGRSGGRSEGAKRGGEGRSSGHNEGGKRNGRSEGGKRSGVGGTVGGRGGKSGGGGMRAGAKAAGRGAKPAGRRGEVFRPVEGAGGVAWSEGASGGQRRGDGGDASGAEGNGGVRLDAGAARAGSRRSASGVREFGEQLIARAEGAGQRGKRKGRDGEGGGSGRRGKGPDSNGPGFTPKKKKRK